MTEDDAKQLKRIVRRIVRAEIAVARAGLVPGDHQVRMSTQKEYGFAWAGLRRWIESQTTTDVLDRSGVLPRSGDVK